VVRVAERVQHAFQRVGGMPVVVHDNARDVRQQAVARSLPLRRRGPRPDRR
jgi:hypothetical protein